MTRQKSFVAFVHFKNREHSSSSTKQGRVVLKPATQLLIMQNDEGHALGREDFLIIQGGSKGCIYFFRHRALGPECDLDRYHLLKYVYWHPYDHKYHLEKCFCQYNQSITQNRKKIPFRKICKLLGTNSSAQIMS